MNFLSIFPTLLTVLGELPKVVSAIEFLLKAINDAEALGVDGPTKLSNVLNDFEAFLSTLNPAWGGDFAPIAQDIEAMVNAVIGFHNDFNHAAASVTTPPAAA